MVLEYIFKIVATILVIISAIIFVMFFIHHSVTDPHVYLTFIGFHILWITGLIWYYELTPIYLSSVIFFVGMALAVVAMGWICIDYGCKHTLHDWLGVFTVFFAISTWGMGFASFYFLGLGTSNYISAGLAITTMVLATLATITAMIIDGEYHDWASCFTLTVHVTIIVLYTLCTVISVVLTVYDN